MNKFLEEKFMFCINPNGQILPIFAQGPYSEMELYEFARERDWENSVPEPPAVGIWVWDYKPTGGEKDYWGEYNDVDIDKGSWRSLSNAEWYCLQNNESPWLPVLGSEEYELYLEDKKTNGKLLND